MGIKTYGSLSDIDKGFRHIIKSMGQAAGHPNAHVVVGWPENTTGGVLHRDSDLTMAELAGIHEFGAPPRIPERSMLRSTADINQQRYIEMTRTIAHGVSLGRASLRDGLGILGSAYAADVQERISNFIPPPNAPRTIARKGSSVPLINSGELRQHIDHQVRDC